MANYYIYGLNTVKSSIESGRVISAVIQKDSKATSLINLLKEKKISYTLVNKDALNKLTKNANHQGIAALVEEYKTISLEKFINKSKNLTKSIVIMLDNIEDPHNLGAILRIADAFKVDAVIFKKAHQVGLTETVAKVSTGAINYIDCVEVSNLSKALKELKNVGYWAYATDMDGEQAYNQVNYADKSVIIIGSEGFGISRLVKENSDVLIQIPMFGHVNSLNASTACAIVTCYLSQLQNK